MPVGLIVTNFILFGGILAGFFLYTNPSTPTGHEGYVYERARIFGKGGYRGMVIGPGNFGSSLWRNEVINIDIRPATYTEKFKILAQDDLNIGFAFHLLLKIKEGTVRQVVEKYGGKNWYERFLKELFRTHVRNAVQIYPSTMIKAKRNLIADQVKIQVAKYLNDTPFVLVSLVVGNVDYPLIVSQAVEKKLAAQQLLEEKETQKLIARKDAEIRIEEAKGIAEAQKIINETLTENYLQHEAINAQLEMAGSPNHTTVYIPAGTNGIPLVHMLQK
ncbi:MAG: hypothetical protein GY862_16890 [Gammaproteobacteria bacterium]|nr:hypothetical protein [Gammaproteobacteria bacterium]